MYESGFFYECPMIKIMGYGVSPCVIVFDRSELLPLRNLSSRNHLLFLRPTTYDLRPTTYDLRPTTYDLRPTTYDLRLTTKKKILISSPPAYNNHGTYQYEY